MPCDYLHKLCPTGKCKNYVCRAYFPEKQPIIQPNQLTTCQGEEYATECLIYGAGSVWRAARRAKFLENHCPFASNTMCGRPDEWWCKGSTPPFKLYPSYDENGELINTKEVLKESCWTGDEKIYGECPFYKEGTEFREYVKNIKKPQT